MLGWSARSVVSPPTASARRTPCPLIRARHPTSTLGRDASILSTSQLRGTAFNRRVSGWDSQQRKLMGAARRAASCVGRPGRRPTVMARGASGREGEASDQPTDHDPGPARTFDDGEGKPTGAKPSQSSSGARSSTKSSASRSSTTSSLPSADEKEKGTMNDKDDGEGYDDAVIAAAAAVKAALADAEQSDAGSGASSDESRSNSSTWRGTAETSEAPAATASDDDDARETKTEVDAEVVNLRAQLLDAFYGTNRGLNASSQTRSEVNELVARLEASNPTPSPTEALATLSGTWRLVYTSSVDLLVLLSADTLPGLSVGEMTQTIDAETASVENRVAFAAPLVETSVSSRASFEVRSPKRLQVKFNEAGVAMPTFTDPSLFALPSSVQVMGQSVDTADVASALQPLQSAVSSALGGLTATLNQLPGLKVPIPEDFPAGSQSWILTTYLDAEVRIARGDGGSVFILTKI